MKIVTVFGAGLLVGTALTVIIPEGIRALYSDILSQHNNVAHNKNGQIIVTGATNINIDNEQQKNDHYEDEHSSTIGLSLVLGM